MVRTGQWISEGWETVKQEIGMWMGVMLVAWLIMSVPIINCAIMMGLFYITLRKVRDRAPLEFGDLFKGFDGFYFGQGILYGIVSSLIVGLAAAVVFVPFVIVGAILAKSSENAATAVLILGYIPLILVALVVQILFIFAPFLIIDRRMGFWDAMMASKDQVMQNLLGFVGFAIVGSLVVSLGALACGIGVLVTAPIYYIALACAYRDNFAFQPQPGVVAPAGPVYVPPVPPPSVPPVPPAPPQPPVQPGV